MEFLGLVPTFRQAAEDGSLEVVEADEPFIQLGTQAAAGGRPFNAVRGLTGRRRGAAQGSG